MSDIPKTGDHLKVIATGGPMGTRLELNGVPMTAVCRVRFDHSTTDAPIVALDLIAVPGGATIELEGYLVTKADYEAFEIWRTTRRAG
jgi:hypothetical protein